MPGAAPQRALCAAALAAAVLTLASAAHARRAATPSLVVTFTPAGAVTVTLPDGTPVGSTSGTPTTIPAGYYTLLLNGPGDCINLPLFELRGPGVNINDDMLGGETDTHTLYAQFQPSSTYTWHLDRSENVVYTFRTAATTVGSPVPVPTSTTPAGTHPKPTSQDVTGSAVMPFRGTLVVALSSGGRLSLAYRNKPITVLKPGRYAIAAVDRSTARGVAVQKLAHSAIGVTGTAFVGKRTATVALTTGKWFVVPRPSKAAASIDVR